MYVYPNKKFQSAMSCFNYVHTMLDVNFNVGIRKHVDICYYYYTQHPSLVHLLCLDLLFDGENPGQCTCN